MKNNNIEKGDFAEQVAANVLIQKGYAILETKYRTPVGEIDIIAKQNEYIVFVEVKYRKHLAHGLPREAVNQAKQRRIRKAALYYVASQCGYEVDMRFDVIEMLREGILHLENAF